MKTDCEYIEEVSAYIDGELAPQRRLELQAHIHRCPACSQTHAALSALDEQVGRIPEIEPSPDFNRAFWRRIDNISRKPKFPVFSQLFHGWKPAMAAAVVLVLVFGALFVVQDDRDVTGIRPNEVVIAEQLDLLDNYEVIRYMEILENWDAATGDNGHT